MASRHLLSSQTTAILLSYGGYEGDKYELSSCITYMHLSHHPYINSPARRRTAPPSFSIDGNIGRLLVAEFISIFKRLCIILICPYRLDGIDEGEKEHLYLPSLRLVGICFNETPIPIFTYVWGNFTSEHCVRNAPAAAQSDLSLRTMK
jgi:hypothetical protein